MFNQNSFSIDSGLSNPNQSFNAFGSPQQKKTLNQSDQSHNDEDYDFGFNLANYTFKQVSKTDKVKENKESQLKIQTKISKQHQFKMSKQKNYQQKKTFNYLQKISEKPSSIVMSDEERPRGLLKQKMKVDYVMSDKRPAQSQLTVSQKPSKKSSPFSEITRSDISANLFSCMDAPEYERDFQISPKVIARKYY